MSSTKPLVLLLGATGKTGSSIACAILDSGSFRLAALARRESASKPEYEKLRAEGVEIRVGDLDDNDEQLRKYVEGVDILISAVVFSAVPNQRGIIRASKEVGVKRFIPCDWATPGAKGIRDIHDTKLAIHEYIKEVGVPYTFIDVGWWMEPILPQPMHAKGSDKLSQRKWTLSHTIVGDGTTPNLVTLLEHIGPYVVRIIADPRTLNHSVIIWEDEVTQLQAQELGERYSGEAEEFRASRIYITEEDVRKAIAEGRELQKNDPNSIEAVFKLAIYQYLLNLFILGENSLENAKKLGYLDVRELYPDIKPTTLEEYAKVAYSKGA